MPASLHGMGPLRVQKLGGLSPGSAAPWGFGALFVLVCPPALLARITSRLLRGDLTQPGSARSLPACCGVGRAQRWAAAAERRG